MSKFSPKKIFLSLTLMLMLSLSAVMAGLGTINVFEKLHSVSASITTTEVTDTTASDEQADISAITETWESDNSVVATGVTGNSDGYSVSGTIVSISNATGLATFASYVNASVNNSYSNYTVKLTSDINLEGKIWTPIGITNAFKGVFDGGGYTISGLTINDTISAVRLGLFGHTYGAIIKDVVLKGVNINNTTHSSTTNEVAGLVAFAENTNIYNCGIVSGQITANTNSQIGGLVGNFRSDTADCVIESSYSYANIHGNTNYAGGLVGICEYGSITVKKCFFAGTNNASGSYKGTLIGKANISIENCYDIQTNIPFVGEGTISDEDRNTLYCLSSGKKPAELDNKVWVQNINSSSKAVMHTELSESANKYVLRGVGNVCFGFSWKYTYNTNADVSGYRSSLGNIGDSISLGTTSDTNKVYEAFTITTNRDYEDEKTLNALTVSQKTARNNVNFSSTNKYAKASASFSGNDATFTAGNKIQNSIFVEIDEDYQYRTASLTKQKYLNLNETTTSTTSGTVTVSGDFVTNDGNLQEGPSNNTITDSSLGAFYVKYKSKPTVTAKYEGKEFHTVTIQIKTNKKLTQSANYSSSTKFNGQYKIDASLTTDEITTESNNWTVTFDNIFTFTVKDYRYAYYEKNIYNTDSPATVNAIYGSTLTNANIQNRLVSIGNKTNQTSFDNCFIRDGYSIAGIYNEATTTPGTNNSENYYKNKGWNGAKGAVVYLLWTPSSQSVSFQFKFDGATVGGENLNSLISSAKLTNKTQKNTEYNLKTSAANSIKQLDGVFKTDDVLKFDIVPIYGFKIESIDYYKRTFFDAYTDKWEDWTYPVDGSNLYFNVPNSPSKCITITLGYDDIEAQIKFETYDCVSNPEPIFDSIANGSSKFTNVSTESIISNSASWPTLFGTVRRSPSTGIKTDNSISATLKPYASGFKIEYLVTTITTINGKDETITIVPETVLTSSGFSFSFTEIKANAPVLITIKITALETNFRVSMIRYKVDEKGELVLDENNKPIEIPVMKSSSPNSVDPELLVTYTDHRGTFDVKDINSGVHSSVVYNTGSLTASVDFGQYNYYTIDYRYCDNGIIVDKTGNQYGTYEKDGNKWTFSGFYTTTQETITIKIVIKLAEPVNVQIIEKTQDCLGDTNTINNKSLTPGTIIQITGDSTASVKITIETLGVIQEYSYSISDTNRFSHIAVKVEGLGSAPYVVTSEGNPTITLTYTLKTYTVNVKAGVWNDDNTVSLSGHKITATVSVDGHDSGVFHYGDEIEFNYANVDGYDFDGLFKIDPTNLSDGMANQSYISGSQSVSGNETYVAVFKRHEYAVSFKTNNPANLATGGVFDVEFGSSSYSSSTEIATGTIKYLTDKLQGTVPTRLVCNSGAYEFKGWGLSADASPSDVCIDADGTFVKKFEETENATFYAIWKASKIKFTYKLNGGNSNGDTSTEGSVTYGGTDYGPHTAPTKVGYAFSHWEKDGAKYDITQQCKFVNADNVTLTAIYTSIEIAIDLYDGTTSSDGNKIGTIYVRYDSNDYYSTLGDSSSSTIKSVTRENYSFNYYSFKGQTEKFVFVDGKDSRNATFTFDYSEEDGTYKSSVSLIAQYNLTKFSITTDEEYNGTYDALAHEISATADLQSNEISSISYQWQRYETKTVDGIEKTDYFNIDGATNQTYSVTNVIDSGKYRCVITVEAALNATNEISAESGEIIVLITPATLEIKQDGKTNSISKQFDNDDTIELPSSNPEISIDGIKGKDQIRIIATYKAGKYICNGVALTTRIIADKGLASNYTIGAVTGSITPKQVTVTAFGQIYQGANTSAEVKLEKTNGEKYFTYDKAQFFDFGVELTITTNGGRNGVYTANNPSYKLKVNDGDLKVWENGVDISENFEIVISGSFEILPADQGITIEINLICDDQNAGELFSLGKNYGYIELTGIDATASGVASLTFDSAVKNKITYTDARNVFVNDPTFTIAVVGLSSNYWITSWECLIDGTKDVNLEGVYALSKDYTIANTNSKNFVFNIKVSRLVTINLDYNLLDGETLENSNDSQTFLAYNMTVEKTKEIYKHTLPTPQRKNFNFLGWKYNQTYITDSSNWSYKANFAEGIKSYTLIADWELTDIDLVAKTDDIDKTYDGLVSAIEFEFDEFNSAVSYTTKWTLPNGDIVDGRAGEITYYNVKDVADSGTYTLTISATYKNVTKSKTVTATVAIAKYVITPTDAKVEKEYDSHLLVVGHNYVGPNNERVSIVGEYEDDDAGSKIIVSSLKVVDTTEAITKGNYVLTELTANPNYQLGTVDGESVINKKAITLRIGTNTAPFDNIKHNKTGEYYYSEIGKTYEYKLTTTGVDAGEYNQTDSKLEITQFSYNGIDMRSNFDITIEGSIVISNATIEYVFENKTVTFNGTQQEISLTYYDLQGDNISVKFYYDNNEIESQYITTTVDTADSTKKIVKINKFIEYVENGYDITAEFTGLKNYNSKSVVANLTINKRDIYVYLDSAFSKTYNGLTDFNDTIGSSYKVFTLKSGSQNNVQVAPASENAYKNYQPEFDFNSDNANVGTNKKLAITLSQDGQFNKNYTVKETNQVVTIVKKDVTLTLSDSKQYDGKGFIVAVAQITANGLVGQEALSGTLTLKEIIVPNLDASGDVIPYNIGEYTGEVTYNLTANNVAFTTNYNPTLSGQLTVNRAKLDVSSVNNQSFVYTSIGITPEFTFVRNDGKTSPKPSGLVVTYKNSSQEVLSSAPINVGKYTASYSLSTVTDGETPSDYNLYELLGDLTVSYEIYKRKVEFEVQEDKEYKTGQVFVRQVLNSDVAQSSEYGIAINDISNVVVTTTTANVGVHYINDSNRCTIEYKIVLKSDETIDVTSNYELSFTTVSYLEIVKQRLTQKDVTLTFVQYVKNKWEESNTYNAQTKYVQLIINDDDAIPENNEKFISKTDETGFTGFITLSDVSLTHGEDKVDSIGNFDEIKFAGVYTFTVTLDNYMFDGTESVFTYTINKQEIKKVAFDGAETDGTAADVVPTKTYDSSSSVTQTITSDNVYSSIDNVRITGSYVDENKDDDENAGVNKLILLKLLASDEKIIDSYEFKLASNIYGTIEKLNVQFTDAQLTYYYTGEDIVCDIFEFTSSLKAEDFAGGLMAEHFEGEISISLYNVGTYDLQSNFSNIDFSNLVVKSLTGSARPISNYNITSFAGSLEICMAQVTAKLSNLNHVYGDDVKSVSALAEIYNNKGLVNAENEIAMFDFVYSLNSSVAEPRNVGTYSITISIKRENNLHNVYQLIDENGNAVSSYVSSSVLTIAQRKVAIYVENEYTDVKNGEKPVSYAVQLKDVIDGTSDSTGGLVKGHEVTGCLTTDGSKVGTYKSPEEAGYGKVINNNIAFKKSQEDVTSNYNIVSYTITIHISSGKEGEINTTAISNLIYSQTDYVASGEIQVGYALDGKDYTLVYGSETNKYVIKGTNEEQFVEYDTSSSDPNGSHTIYGLQILVGDEWQDTTEAKIAGNYKFKVNIGDIASYKGTEIEFTIAQKAVTLVAHTADKVYDATSTVFGAMTSAQVYSGDDVSFSAKYYNGTTETSKAGDWEIKVTMTGADSANYVLDLGELTGTISQKEIVVTFASNLTYCGTNPTVTVDKLSTTSSFVTGQSWSGSVDFLKINIGEYSVNNYLVKTDNLKVKTSDEKDVTENYKFTFQGSVTIVALHVSVVADEIDLTYDSTILTINQFLSMPDLADELQEEAKNAWNITYSAVTVNAGSYTANLTSNNNNYVFEGDISYSFEIKKRDITINLGEIEVVYNPTSNHQTEFSNEYVTNLVTGQTLSGLYYLDNSEAAETGLGVGTYTEQDKLKFKDIMIVHDGVNVTANYNITSQVGIIKIIPYDISSSNIKLRVDSFVYNKTDISSKLIIQFYDANGVRQEIASTYTTWGSYSLNDVTEAVNKGVYTITVVVHNCNLENDQFSFEINPIKITNIGHVADKNYDGTAYVKNTSLSTSLSSSQILSADREYVVIRGYYCVGDEKFSDVGEYTIKFEIENAEEIPQMNYVIDVQSTGSINKIDLVYTVLSEKVTYNQTGIYQIAYSSSTFRRDKGSLVNGQTLSGFVQIEKPDYDGSYTFTASQANLDNFKVMAGETDVTTNYNITVKGTIVINKAQVSVDFSRCLTSFVYNASEVQFDLAFVNVKVEDQTLPNMILSFAGRNTTNYTSNTAPIDVGEYTLTVSIDNAHYEIVETNTLDFAITPYAQTLTSEQMVEFSKVYGEQDPQFEISITSDLSEAIVVELERLDKSEEVGAYDLSVKSWNDNNYTITLESGAGDDLFTIKKAKNLVVTIKNTAQNAEKLTKVYDTYAIGNININDLEVEANGETLAGNVNFGTSVNAGNHSLQSSNVTSENYEQVQVVSEIDYVISKKAITLQSNNTNKVFDASNKFIGTISVLDDQGVALSTVYPLEIVARYASINVGENIAINISIQNDSESNYEISSSLTGNITARKVTVTPLANQQASYGTTSYTINYEVSDGETTDFYGEFKDYITEINLFIKLANSQTKFTVGHYEIFGEYESDNLNITFTPSVTFEITKKVITIVTNDEAGFTKVYDGTSNVTNQVSVQEGDLVEGDVVTIVGYYYNDDFTAQSSTVGNNKNIRWELSGADAGNYEAKFSYGSILAKSVKLTFVYENSDMLYAEKIQDNTTQSVSLYYGQSVEFAVGNLPVPSHEGYTFAGWYFDEQYTSEITRETVIGDDNWGIDTEEKQAYAKWDIKLFNVNLVIATKINGTYQQSEVGGQLSSTQLRSAYMSSVTLSGYATANAGFEFAGYSDTLSAEVNPVYEQAGIQIEASDITLYAKFKPLSVVFTVNANGGTLSQANNWKYNEARTIASVQLEYNSLLSSFVTMPTATRVGHEFISWIDGKGQAFDVSETRVVDFLTDTVVYASWETKSFTLSLSANGGYFAEGFDTNVWTAQTDENGKAVKVEKQVEYDKPVGEILVPVRSGYTFSNWDDISITPSTTWTFLDAKELNAVWSENIYHITVEAEKGSINATVYNKNNEKIDVINGEYTVKQNEQGQTILTLSTTCKVEIEVVCNKGWVFVNWVSSDSRFNDKQETSISAEGFTEDVTLDAMFTERENKITITSNNNTYGYVVSGEYSSKQLGVADFIAKTGTTVEVTAVNNEGYELTGWTVDSNGEIYKLSGTNLDTTRVLSDFVSDVTITANFAPRTNKIVIACPQDAGTITYNSTTSQSETASVTTITPLVFTVNASHGYLINKDIASWVFETQSTNKGVFKVDGDEKVATITFTGFTADGQITIPFIKETFTITVEALVYDETLSLVTKERIATIDDGSNVRDLNSSSGFTYQYQTQVTLTPNDVVEGHNFYAWSVDNTKIVHLMTNQGLVKQNADGSIVLSVYDNMTLYLVYMVESYLLDFSVNDSLMGKLEMEDFNYLTVKQEVNYGENAKAVTAIATEGFVFVNWVKVEGDTTTVVTTDATIQITNAFGDANYVAVFQGTEMTLNVTFKLREDSIFTDEEIDFGSLIINQDDVTKVTSSEKGDNQITYVITSLTGQTIEFRLVSSSGYVYSGFISDPRINYTRDEGVDNFAINRLCYSTDIIVYMEAEVNEITINLTGKSHGATVSEYNNISKGVTETVVNQQKNQIVISVRTGGDVGAIIYANNGYKINEHESFVIHRATNQTTGAVSEYAIGSLINIQEDKVLNVNIESYKYQVTFDYNYDVLVYNPDAVEPASVVTIAEFGETEFNPSIGDEVKKPTVDKYEFIGWNTKADASGTTYYFDEAGKIYRVVTIDGVKTRQYGFAGSNESVAAVSSDFDFTCSLYGMWQVETYSVDVVIVPSSAVYDGTGNIMPYINSILPNLEGRITKYADDFSGTVVSMTYVPGYEVKIVPPRANDNCQYYGWAYEGNLVNKAEINTNEFVITMGEEDIVVYLYYTFNVNVEQGVGGTATISETNVLAGQEFTLSAKPNAGYDFAYWTKNGQQIDASTETMTVTSDIPATYAPVFVGHEVEVRFVDTEFGKGRVFATTGISGQYRVGDTITIEVYDVKYGYSHTGWEGSYNLSLNEYTLTATDDDRGFVEFKPVFKQRQVKVLFRVKDSVGGNLIIDNKTTITAEKMLKYADTFKFGIEVQPRYVLAAVTINGNPIDITSYAEIELLLTNAVGFVVDGENVVEVSFSQLLWIDVWTMFTGMGTEEDPYVITNVNELAAMAYLINNNISSNGTVPYSMGYYKVKVSLDLLERFWQPIGTEDNPFDGTFEILGNNINNLVTDKEYAIVHYNGLFGYLGPNAKIISNDTSTGTVVAIVVVAVSVLIAGVGTFVTIIVIKRRKIKKLQNSMNTVNTLDLNSLSDEKDSNE